MPLQQPPKPGLFHFRPPYHNYHPVPLGCRQNEIEPGASLIWMIAPVGKVYSELDRVSSRHRGLPLFVVLPQPSEILSLASILRDLPNLRPKAVVPSAGEGFVNSLRRLLSAPPRRLPAEVADHLDLAHMIPDQQSREVIQTVFRVAPQVSSIDRLAARMCWSRRTLGRFFQERGLPVPSHWLQFARILHVAIRLQNAETNINRISARFGYTDGFTMSNSMKRLTGYRPSFVREHLGWEWIVESWIRRERGDS